MRILVCVKQVPRLDQVRFQPGINRIVREGVESGVNPLDLVALRWAARLRAEHGGEIVVATMGPPAARAVLANAVRWGADRGVHLVDPRFAGADTLATARALADLVARERPDLVLLGDSTVDSGTAQVAPQLAELAGLAQLTRARTVRVAGGAVASDAGRVALPAVVSVVDDDDPVGPADVAEAADVADVSAAADRIEELDADALGGDPARYGIRGSATYVRQVLDIAGYPSPVAHPSAPAEPGREIWVLVEPGPDGVHPVSLAGLAAAGTVAGRLGASVIAVVLGDPSTVDESTLVAAGATRVRRESGPAEYAPEPVTDALAELVRKESPYAVIGGWTGRGRDCLPRVAARLGLGMTGDVIGLDVAPNPGDPSALDLVWLKPAVGDTVLALVVARTVPSFGTLRP